MNTSSDNRGFCSNAPLAVYCAAHFAVDMCCFYIIFAFVAPACDALTTSWACLGYNCAAFGLQPLIGLLADKKPRFPIGFIGALLVGVALALGFSPLLALGVCALGNALFHVGGGRYSLASANGRMSRPGVFVSTGALGVAAGALAGKGGAGLPLPLGIIVVCASLTLAVEHPRIKPPESARGLSERNITNFKITSSLPFAALLTLPLAAIVVRSYVGFIIPMDWKTTAALSLVPAIASFAGKAAGGFIADRLGARRTATAALLLSIPALCFGADSAAVCAVGIFLFNMAMPISLCTVAEALPDNPGLAFGMTTLALLVGSMPSFIWAVSGGVTASLIATLTLAAAACSYLSTSNRRSSK